MNAFLTLNKPSYVNRAAFATATTLSFATIGFTVACATATSTVTAVALGILAVIALSASMGSIGAWCFKNSHNIKEYAEGTADITAKIFVVTIQFIAQNVFQALIEGVCRAVSEEAYKKVRAWFSKK